MVWATPRAPQSIQIYSDKPYLKIAFGSCYQKKKDTDDIFATIMEEQPDLFIWSGDATYIDKSPFYDDSVHFAKKFEETKENPSYKLLLEKTKVIGIWDDHDFGKNDGGKSFNYKDEIRPVFLDFVGEGNATERRL